MKHWLRADYRQSENLTFQKSEGKGFEPLTFDSDVLRRQVSLKHRVWQRRLFVPIGPYMRKTLAIGR